MFKKIFKKSVVSVFIAVLLLASSLAVLTQSNVADAADYTTQVRLYLSVRPTVVGVGQEFLVNVWGTPAPGAARCFHNYILTVVKPDGTSDSYTFDSYVDDGTMWMPWVADQPGDWTFKFEYPGEYFAPGRYIGGELSDASTGGTVYADGAKILGGSARDVVITVQDEIVPSWPEAPLPTGYWTWPIGEENRDWWPITGNWPWFGPTVPNPEWDKFYPRTNPTNNSLYGFLPWVTGPESAHIVWKRDNQIAGIQGGDMGSASHIDPNANLRNAPSVILDGKAYNGFQGRAKDGAGVQTYWECYDWRTGTTIWTVPLLPGEAEPNIIEYSAQLTDTMAQFKPGAPSLLSLTSGANSRLCKYNPVNGAMTLNLTLPSFTSNTYYKNGFVLSIQDLGADAGAERYRLINWTTIGTSTTFASRIYGNTTYQRSALPTAQVTDWNVGIGCTVSGSSQGGMFTAINVQGFDLFTGRSLWNKTLNEPLYSGSSNVADHGKVAIVSADGYIVALDLVNGNEAWRTERLDYPWDEPGWGAYSATSAYGQIYWSAQTGIYAIDWATGKINWKFEKEAPPFETPYTGRQGQTVYPFACGSLVLDGKLYVYSQEHTPDIPFFRGSPLVCLDVFTGEEIWSIGMNSGIFLRRGAIVACGGSIALDARDGNMYVFGIGLSETTVSAPQLTIPVGQKVLLTGTILDLSPAQSGVPCVAKESVAAQMEHIHMQVPVGGLFDNVPMIGVPVHLYAVDPNGNSVEIGTVISDGYSGTFAFDGWTPNVPGLYTITATFLGDESYDGSSATTYLTVAEGAPVAPTDNTVLYAVIGATVVMIVCFLIFRKK